MPFAQLVIGPPGSGKSTYCDGMHQFMSAINRKCSVVNLDPANDRTNYDCALDIRELVSLEDVMEQEELGPNGGVLYALEELEVNWEWMETSLKELKDDYVIFDCPGQVELFTHHETLPRIFNKIEKLGYRLVVVQLIDSVSLSRPSLYISSLLLCLRGMLHMPFPLVNVFTKIDNLSRIGETLPFNLDFYTDVQDLEYLLPHLQAEQDGGKPEIRDPASQTKQSSKLMGLNRALIGLVEDFGLVGFETLAVEDKTSMMNLLHAIDRAGGYVFGGDKGTNDTVWQVAMREGWSGKMDVRDIQERWIDRREEYDEAEEKQWEEEAGMANRDAPMNTDEVSSAVKSGVHTGKPPKSDAGEEDLDALADKFMSDLQQNKLDSQPGATVVRKT